MEPALEGISGYINQESNEILIKCKEDFLIIKRKYEENNNHIFSKIHIDMKGKDDEIDLPKNIIIENLKISNYKYSLDNLPDNIKSLILINYYHPFDNLPLNLETFEIGGEAGVYNQSFDNLPSNLKNLTIVTSNIKDDYNLNLYDNLPDNLKALTISNPPYGYSFANLPKKLEYFNICLYGSDIGLKDYPENLKKFQIVLDEYEYKDIEELPNNLTRLTLTIPINKMNLEEIINEINSCLKIVNNKLNKLKELVIYVVRKEGNEEKIIKIKELIEEKKNILPYEVILSYHTNNNDIREYHKI